jgi:glycosyltransferase involved in cell wall biosynthesis
LETALAAATHQRDLAAEQARLAGEGVEQLERRLEAREEHLANAQAGIEARDRKLEAANEGLEALEAELEARRTEAATANARLELREEELERARAAVDRAQGELAALRERLAEKERDLALRERDLEARVRELGQAGEELVGRERELDAAGTLLETQGAELARSREALAEERAALSEAREATQVAERERDEARVRLGARERHLDNAKQGIEARDRRLEVADQRLGKTERALRSRDAELERLRVAARAGERRLALAEARLEKAQERAERFRGSLVELREGRSYRLMRVLWRLRRPFRRAPREATAPQGPVEDDADSSPPASPPASVEVSTREIAVAEREPPRRPPRGRLRVASILDTMSEACFAPDCELVPLSLDGWSEQLDESSPDLLLVESAWNANGGEWQYRIAEYPRKDLVGLPALRALLDGCRERGIPTAFWNKEDPVHFDRFSEAASLFDHVLTTDARCVERYRALPGERTVTPLPFAAQPRIHNPIAAVPERSSSPCFAGAWYRDRHPDRRRALEELLDAARPYGLVIYDRRFGADDDAFGFPDRFAPHVLGRLPYERILDVYRSHLVFLNANSVVDSPTMCSRRVFELAACDTAILSTPGAALAALLGAGAVEEASDEAGAAAALERLLGDEDERRRRTRAARRAVFAAHTYADRLATIAAVAGLDASSLRSEPFAASASGASRRDVDDHPWELVLQPGVTLSEPALADLAAAATFAAADAIGVGASNGIGAPEHSCVENLDPRALLLRRELIEARGLPSGSPEQIEAQLRRWSDEGVRLYAADADLLRV